MINMLDSNWIFIPLLVSLAAAIYVLGKLANREEATEQRKRQVAKNKPSKLNETGISTAQGNETEKAPEQKNTEEPAQKDPMQNTASAQAMQTTQIKHSRLDKLTA